MLDKSLPYKSIIMRMEAAVAERLAPPAPAAGYRIRPFAPGDERHWARIETSVGEFSEEAAAREVGTLVLGLPKNMDGSEGVRAEKSRRFKEMLEAECSLPVVLWDERRSSIEAHAILHASGKKEKKHRKTVDAVAASLILEGYLGSI